MSRLREWAVRVSGSLGVRRSDADLEAELRSHLALAAAGEPAGGIAHGMDALRDQRGLPWIDDLVRDVRHGVRLLRAQPAFTAVAVLSLALGIGANSAIFSLADALILRPLPVADPGAVMTISAESPGESGERFSYPDYRDLRDQSRSFDGMVAYDISTLSLARSRHDAAEKRIGMLVSGNFFEVLGVSMARGRSFTPDESRVPGRDAVVVLAYDYWKNALGGEPGSINKPIWINGIEFQVIGVAGADFTGVEDPLRPAFYVPITMSARLGAATVDPLEQRDARTVWVKGRLRSGLSASSAQAEIATLWSGLERQYPGADRHRTIAVRGEIQERMRDDPEDAVLLGILGALAAVVLLIACANVANLTLSRIRGRSREIAVRLALGVSRGRLIRQLLTESFILACCGLVVGLAFAALGIRFLQTLPTRDQIVIAPQLDQRVLMFGLLATIVSALVFGVAPIRQSFTVALTPALKSAGPGETPRSRLIGRSVLVVSQVALSLVLLIATGTLFDGFRKALVIDPGFRPDGALVASVDTSLRRYTPAQTHAFYRDLVDRVRGLPHVASVALTSAVPLRPGDQHAIAVAPEGYTFPPGQARASILSAVVDAAYFSTMRVEVVRGRAFDGDDRDTSRPVAIVNEAFAQRYWPNQDPLGKRIELAGTRVPAVVVGVTPTGKHGWIGEPPTPFIYLPFAQQERAAMTIVVLASGDDPAALAGPLRDVVRSLDVDQPLFDVQALSTLYRERAITVPLMIMQVVGTMGLLGLALALIGLYGLVAYSVARRTHEIGIRIAIGASAREVLAMVLRQGFVLSAAGALLGGLASIGVARVLAAVLAGLGRPSPVTYVVVPIGLMALTMVASYFPARRASRVDPLLALRED